MAKGQRDELARREFLAQLAAGATVTAACKAAGLSRTAPYKWAERGDLKIRGALNERRRKGKVRGAKPKDMLQAAAPPKKVPAAAHRAMAPAARMPTRRSDAEALAGSPTLPSAQAAYDDPCAWAQRCAGVAAVEGEVARRMGVANGSMQPRWRLSKHLRYIGDLLLSMFAGDLLRAIITMPPRHGKSALCSRAFASWWLGRRPDDEIIIASYGDRLPRGWSQQAKRDLVTHGLEVFGVTAIERASGQEWQPIVEGLPSQGNFLATSSGGLITGKGAHLLIVDDLLKGVEECRSKAKRDTIWDWFMDEALTRLAPGGRVLCIGTRWHPDDVIGRLLDARRQAGGEETTAIPWKYVALPAFAEEDDALGRAPGEALWPERFPVKALERIKAPPRTPRSWAALYMCRPVAVGGEFFRQEWIRYWKLDGPHAVLSTGDRVSLSNLYVYITCDLAVSTKDKSDYSAIATWGFDSSRKSELIMLDLICERMEGPDMIPRIRAAADRWGARGIWIEKTIYHTSLIDQARRDGMIIGELHPDTDKKTRAIPATIAMQGGQLYFRAGAPWLATFEDHLLSFPLQGVPDDDVDCVSYAVQLFQDAVAAPVVDEWAEDDPDGDAWWSGSRGDDW